MITENFNVFFADFGSTATVGAQSAKVIMDMPSEIIAGGMVISTDYHITFKTSDLTLVHGDTMTIGGITYKVRDVRFKDDGKLSEAYLSKI